MGFNSAFKGLTHFKVTAAPNEIKIVIFNDQKSFRAKFALYSAEAVTLFRNMCV
jgi:hypothetical protein